MFKPRSARDKGTLYQLRNLLNRRNVSQVPKANFDGCDDFFNTVVDGHILAAAMEFLEMTSISDNPTPESLQNLVGQSKEHRADTLIQISSQIASKYVELRMEKSELCRDGVYGYACKVLSVGLFYREFCDAIREGDGNRVLRCWRYMFLIFKANRRVNYAIEAFTLLANYHFILSPRQCQQLIWSRFVNVHGIIGHNIPCDLFMEHLNRLCKSSIENLGANKTEKAIERVGKVISVLQKVTSNYDTVTSTTESSGAHKRASAERDVMLVLDEVHKKSAVFRIQPGRSHSQFQKQVINVIANVDANDLREWMANKMNLIVNGF